eukprot:COSAG02_NODE_49265_length_328_cov_0.554585_1_plen_34_part_10
MAAKKKLELRCVSLSGVAPESTDVAIVVVIIRLD